MTRHLLPLAAAAALPLSALPLSAAAQEPVLLDPIIVSGGLTPVDAQSYARAVSIITAEDLERGNPRTFADALRTVPGVSVSRSGGPGGLTQIRLRGAEANHVLVLIDGVETADSAGGADFSSISAEMIERIEVLRGPQSALYGAGATAGVINIITKGGRRGETRMSGSVEGSSAPGLKLAALMQTGLEDADLALGLSFKDDAGWDVSGDGGEKDGVRDLTLTARGSVDIGDMAVLRGNLRFTDRTGEYDATAFGCGGPECYVVDAEGLENTTTQFTGGLAADVETFGGAFVITPSLGYSQKESEDDGQYGFSFADASTLKLGLQGALTFGARDQHTLVGALQWKGETFSNTYAGGDVKRRNQMGYVLDYRGEITEALFVQGGLRFDDNDRFDDFLSWSASASYNVFSTGTRLRASVGEAQTNPDFFQQFGYVPGRFTGNPDLTPERNFGWDVGVDQQFWDGRAEIGLTYFNETLQDEIVGAGLSVDNIDGESERQGVELSLRVAPVDGLNLGASYTWLDATEPTGPGGAQRTEVRRPTHSGSFDVGYTFMGGRATLGAEAVWAAEGTAADFGDPSFTSPRIDLEDYVTVNISASYAVSERVELFGGVRNLFDSDHQEVPGYAEQPLTGYLGVRATW